MDRSRRIVKKENETQKEQKIKYLLRNMHRQQNMLNEKTQYTSGFDPYTQEWYFSSLENRSTNLEHMYRTILRYSVNKEKMVSSDEIKRALSTIVRLCRRKDNNHAIALPHWIIAALFIFLTRLSAKMPSWNGGKVLIQMLREKCQRGCQTFLQIVLRELKSDGYLYVNENIWINGTGLVPLPKVFLKQVITFTQRTFFNDIQIDDICGQILFILSSLKEPSKVV